MIENQGRAYLAVGLQSIGYRTVYEWIFALTGIKLVEDDMTSLFLRASEDMMKLWRQEYRRKESVKSRRMLSNFKKISDGGEKLKKGQSKSFGV
jgi:hypothetical protein